MEKFIPTKGYCKRISTGEVFEGTIFLGKYDNLNDYAEITKTQYEQELKRIEEEQLAEQKAMEV